MFTYRSVSRSSAVRPASFCPQVIADAVEVEPDGPGLVVARVAADDRWGAQPVRCAAVEVAAAAVDDSAQPGSVPDDCSAAPQVDGRFAWAAPPDDYSAADDSALDGCCSAQADSVVD